MGGTGGWDGHRILECDHVHVKGLAEPLEQLRVPPNVVGVGVREYDHLRCVTLGERDDGHLEEQVKFGQLRAVRCAYMLHPQ